jgi:hypothetical protein
MDVDVVEGDLQRGGARIPWYHLQPHPGVGHRGVPGEADLDAAGGQLIEDLTDGTGEQRLEALLPRGTLCTLF